MSNELKSPENSLRKAREALYQEWTHLQVVGHALSPDEQRRSLVLGRVILLLDQALAALEEPGPIAPGKEPSGKA